MSYMLRRHQRLKIFSCIVLSFVLIFRRHVFAGVRLVSMPLIFKLGHVGNPLTFEADQFDVTFKRYSSRPDQAGNDSEYAVPPIIHNVFIGSTDNFRPAWEEARSSCRALHPGYTFEFWDEARAKIFVEEQFPSVWPTWRDYRYPIQKADSLRYMLLHHYGGVFMDMDLYCVRPLTPLRQFDFIAAAAYPSGVSNGFIMSKPRLPFMAQVIQSLEPYDLSWFNLPYVTVSFSTGCHYLSWVILAMSFLTQTTNFFCSCPSSPNCNQKSTSNTPGSPPIRTIYASTTSSQRTNLRILQGPPENPQMHRLNGNATTPLFRHLGSSSWHNWDAVVFKSFKNHISVKQLFGFGKSTCVAGLGLLPLIVVLLSLAAGIRQLIRVVQRRSCGSEGGSSPPRRRRRPSRGSNEALNKKDVGWQGGRSKTETDLV